MSRDPAVDITQCGFKPLKKAGYTVHEIDHLIDMNLSIRRDFTDPSHIQENKTFVDALLEMRFALTGKDRPKGPSIKSILFIK